jgi:hypothetical protein
MCIVGDQVLRLAPSTNLQPKDEVKLSHRCMALLRVQVKALEDLKQANEIHDFHIAIPLECQTIEAN